MSAQAPHPPITHIEISGDNESLGRLTGVSSSHLIKQSLATYKKTFSLCNISWADAIQKASIHLPVIREFTPHLLEELNGLALGADDQHIDVESLLALNCRTEILPPDFLARAMASVQSDTAHNPTNECTSLAVARANSPVWLAQNWDWLGSQRDNLIVLQAKRENGPDYITVTEAGMLAKIGINNNGLGVSLNILRSHNDGESAGMPVHFLLRALLDCKNVEDACNLASKLPFASSSNVLMADKDGNIASLEISPAGVRILQPEKGQLCHTNHFLHPEFTAADAGVSGNTSTLNRLKVASDKLSNIHDFTDIKHLLSDSSDGTDSICRFADHSLPQIAQIETVVAVAMNLSELSLQVSAAQPSISDFTEYRFDG